MTLFSKYTFSGEKKILIIYLKGTYFYFAKQTDIMLRPRKSTLIVWKGLSNCINKFIASNFTTFNGTCPVNFIF